MYDKEVGWYGKIGEMNKDTVCVLDQKKTGGNPKKHKLTAGNNIHQNVESKMKM